MGRGLSSEQKRILGIAFHANRITQDGAPSLKSGEPVKHYKVDTVDYDGPKDMFWTLAAHIIRQIEWTCDGDRIFKSNRISHPTGAYFDLTNSKNKSAKAATIRAISSLYRRGLLILAPKDGELRWGYVLTAEGFAIGKDLEEEFDPYLIVRAGMFGFGRNKKPSDMYEAAKSEPLMNSIRYPKALIERAKQNKSAKCNPITISL